MQNNEISMVSIGTLESNISVQEIEIAGNPGIQMRSIQKAGVITAVGLSLAVSMTSPATSIQLPQSFSNANAITYYKQQQGKTLGRRISRAEALALCQKIAEDAERERIEFAEKEAQRGLPREFYS